MRCERGYTKQLPDLAVWLKRSGPPIALISESGGRREDRQKKVLEGWRDAVYAGQYSAVLYDCWNDSVAHWISRLAAKVRLTRSEFGVVVQARAEEISTLARADADCEGRDAEEPEAAAGAAPTPNEKVSSAQVDVRVPAASVPVPTVRSERPAPRPETAEEAAERERRYREMFGITEPKRRRRWRR